MLTNVDDKRVLGEVSPGDGSLVRAEQEEHFGSAVPRLRCPRLVPHIQGRHLAGNLQNKSKSAYPSSTQAA